MTSHRLTAAVGASLLVAGGIAKAQTSDAEANVAAPFGSPIQDRRIYWHGLLDQLEARIGTENSFRWDGEAWVGTDTNHFWLKSEGTVTNGTVGDGSHQALYDRPITTYFDVQAGIRYDIDSGPSRGWAALGIQGLAPEWFNVEATAYASDSGHFAGRLQTFYDVLLTNRLILEPQIELNFYSKSDPRRGTGSGLSDLDAGLRLRYQFTQKFAPYIGVVFEDKFGGSAAFARRQGETVNDVRFAVGIRSWF
jgi:copper resistance protein B